MPIHVLLMAWAIDYIEYLGWIFAITTMSAQKCYNATTLPNGVLTKRTWWRHQMETFSALLALCEGNSSATGEFPSQRPVTRSLDDFFHSHLRKLLSKQLKYRWFETPLRSLWRLSNEYWLCQFRQSLDLDYQFTDWVFKHLYVGI